MRYIDFDFDEGRTRNQGERKEKHSRNGTIVVRRSQKRPINPASLAAHFKKMSEAQSVFAQVKYLLMVYVSGAGK